MEKDISNDKPNKCEEIGFFHAWKENISNIVYDTYPPSYPDRSWKCLNCGLIKTENVRTETTYKYSDGKERKYT